MARLISFAAVVTAATLATCLLAATAQATYPGSNGKILYTSLEPGLNPSSDIWALDPATDATSQVTHAEPGPGDLPANTESFRVRAVSATTSADGTRLFYDVFGSADTANGSVPLPTRVYSSAVDGSNVKALFKSTDLGRSRGVAAFPSGKHLAYAMGDDIWSIGLGGLNITPFSPEPTVGPAVSPAGTRVAFSREREYAQGAFAWDLWLMNSDGSNAIQRTFTNDENLDPSFSPSGATIVFSRWSPVTDRSDIYSMKVLGGGFKKLTAVGDNSDPVFSPDGKRIAFVSVRGGTPTGEIYTMNADGSNQVRRTFNSVRDSSPEWAVASPPPEK